MSVNVFDFLHYGKENAVKSKILADTLGYKSVRDLKKNDHRRSGGTVGGVINGKQ